MKPKSERNESYCEKYDKDFFKENILILVLLEEGSGSVRHEVTALKMQNGNLEIYINRIVPECGTDDMAEWHILIEPEKGAEIPGEENINVIID